MEDYPSKQVPENLDDPPNSRLFLVTSRSISEDELRERFSRFGDIQGVWVVKDRQTKESKGISYIKFAKSSQACAAMEEMHGQMLSDKSKPIKVRPTQAPFTAARAPANMLAANEVLARAYTAQPGGAGTRTWL